jgi:hypothetical protein
MFELNEVGVEELDQVIDELSALVCEVGPDLLTRGMDQLTANKALLACIKKLREERDALAKYAGELDEIDPEGRR